MSHPILEQIMKGERPQIQGVAFTVDEAVEISKWMAKNYRKGDLEYFHTYIMPHVTDKTADELKKVVYRSTK